MPAKKRPRKIYLGRMDYCKNEYQRQKLYKSLCGKVVVSFMYEQIENVKSIPEIEAMPFDKAKEYIELIRKLHPVAKLRKHWNTSQYTIYNKLFPKYSIPVEPKGGYKGRKDNKVEIENKEVENKEIQIKAAASTEVFKEPVSKSSFKISLEGTFQGEDLGNRLNNITSILGDQTTYRIGLSISENNPGSLFTINFGGNFVGKEVSDTIANMKSILFKDKQYIVQYIMEELERQVVTLTLGEIASTK